MGTERISIRSSKTFSSISFRTSHSLLLLVLLRSRSLAFCVGSHNDTRWWSQANWPSIFHSFVGRKDAPCDVTTTYYVRYVSHSCRKKWRWLTAQKWIEISNKIQNYMYTLTASLDRRTRGSPRKTKREIFARATGRREMHLKFETHDHRPSCDPSHEPLCVEEALRASS